MTHAVSESATWPTTVTVPDDGDDLVASTGTAAIDGPLGDLAKRTRWLHNLLNGFMLGGETLSSTGGTSLTAPALEQLVLGDQVLATPSVTIGPSQLDTGSVFAANTRYHVYAYGSNLILTVAVFEISLTAPDNAKRFKSGDGTRRYIGTFMTDSSGNVLPFEKVRGQYLHTLSKSGTGWGLSSTAAPTSVTAVDLVSAASSTKLVPSWARMVLVRVIAGLPSSAVPFAVSIRTDTADAGSAIVLRGNGLAGSTSQIEGQFWVKCNSSQQIAFSCTAGITGVDWQLAGWMEG